MEWNFFVIMYRFILVFVLCVVKIQAQSVPGEAWVSRARLVGAVDYFTKVIQEMIYDVERYGWYNLKLTNIEQNLDTVIANWHVNGTVLYTNGFVKSIQKIDVSTVTSTFSRVIENVTVIPSANVNGRLHFRNINIGYDVIADITGLGEQRYTGEILCTNAAFTIRIARNVMTEEYTVSSSIQAIEGSNIQMIYRPENNITQVLSRNIRSSDTWDGMENWNEIFVRILENVVKNKVEFPRYCFNDCT